ncbi:MAG: tandem-95 repeat protein [Candidatus Marinimicrobia bacterium]|nr:tandem-95 repeat protein [Candidatus Neomarinimicrobiota bacterium]
MSFFLITCGGGGGGGDSAPTEPTGSGYVIELSSLSGNAQKGPFNNGTSINVAELTIALSPTGRNFSSQITDNSGLFSVTNVQLTSPYVELRALGFYFNEVANATSDAQLTLYALSDLTNKTSLNVNLLSHLEKNRITVLMSGNNPKTFAQAKLQAQEEVLAIFDYSRANMPDSELLDITQAGAGNAKLLAISAIFQGDLTVGQMSELLANISTDITSDGTLDDASLGNTLMTNAANLDFAAIRNNLVVRYASLGMSVNIPDFETEINQFLKSPVVQDINISTNEDTAINITLAGSDPEGESITYSLVDDSNNATITINGNVANYVPNANWNGTDTFSYKANDGTSDSNIGTVTITVNPIDDEPNTIDSSVDTDEDTAVDVSLTANEYDGENYSFSIISNPSNGGVSLSGTTATYTPNQDWNGTDTFTFEATDDRTSRTNVATATITVNPVNDAPVADNTSGSGDEDTAVDITMSGTDIDGDNLTYSVVATNNGTVTIDGAIATYTSTQDWNGTDTFTYKVNDGFLDSNTATVTVTVAAVNDAPVSSGVGASTNEDIAKTVTLSASDVDSNSLTYSIVSNPSKGSLGNVSGTDVIYTPNANWNGIDTFTYKANDGALDSNVATVTIDIANVGGEINFLNATNDDLNGTHRTEDAYTLKWNYTGGGTSETYNIYLNHYEGHSQWGVGTFSKLIATVDPQVSRYDGTFDSDLYFHTEYYFKIVDADESIRNPDEGVTWSFNILPKDAYATMVDPNGGEQIAIGSTYTIKYDVSDDVNTGYKPGVEFNLYKNSTHLGEIDDENNYISGPVSNNNYNGEYEWNVTNIYDPGTYKIELRSMGSHLNDYTDDTFEIINPMTLTFPIGGETLIAGQTYQITWSNGYDLVENLDLRNDTFGGGAPYGNVCLYGCGGTADGTVGSFSWSIPSDVPTDSNYYLKIGADTSTNLPGDTTGMFTIKSPWANTKSLNFDSNIHAHVDMGTTAGVFTTTMTVQAWAKATALQSNKHIVSKGNDSNQDLRAYSLMAPYATEEFSGAKDNWTASMNLFQLPVGNTEYRLTSSTAATLNAWAHLVMTYDGSNIKLYVNGTLEDTQAATGNIGGSLASIQKFLVGDHNITKPGYNFDGRIDGVAIWDIALTASDVTTLYNSGDGEDPSEVESSNLQGYWNFEDNANDLSSNNNDGTLFRATYVSDVPSD